MTTTDLKHAKDFTIVVEADEERAIKSVYCADLLSWAMGRAPADSAWFTVMGNVNAVAVASLADVAAIVLCEGAQLDADAQKRAETQGICIAQTGLPAFDAALVIAKQTHIYADKL